MKPVIICVDDESLILDSLKIVLKEYFGNDYSIESAENGLDALELIEELTKNGVEIPILISDYVMPEIKGDELLILAHNKIPDALKIMLTGQADLEGVENVINKATLYRFLGKPWSKEDFILTISEALKSFNQSKQIRIQNLELEKSEQKYKNLVENSLDIIFALDKDERIISINQSVSKILRFNPKSLLGKKFSDLLYKSDLLNSKFIEEKILELINLQRTVSFNCDLVNAAGEPKELLIKLQYMNVNNEATILGTASNLEEDLLLRLCEAETQIYKIGNYITQIDLVCKRISDSVSKYCSLEEIYSMKLCVRELLVNAMEHGNLEISFDEKTKALENDEYYELLMSRQNSPDYKNRRIMIKYTLVPDKVEICITDEGKGFNHKKRIADFQEKDIFHNNLAHGRGIQMAKDFFNVFEYNEKGNSILIIKNFN